ncbi:helix-turn-helix domain-containing protein [Klebsiella pneumoniae]|uniref:helix-turn-helix domain-containing protein n=1 Tax=Klebsiella pneumoniae TaxID=573 RepID=UPI003CF6E518
MAPAADLQRTYRAAPRRIYSGEKAAKVDRTLAHSNEPILNVAIALGFDSQQSFNRSFKRQYGQAPGVWRRSISRSVAQTSRQRSA